MICSLDRYSTLQNCPHYHNLYKESNFKLKTLCHSKIASNPIKAVSYTHLDVYKRQALGYHACSLGYRVTYFNAPKLFAKLKMAKADGSYIREVAKIERVDLLILDDFGLQPLDAMNRAAMMEIIEDRHGKGSIIITSQIPVNKWYDIIGEQTVADAILDRIIHEAHRLELKGESLRKKEKIMEELITEFD